MVIDMNIWLEVLGNWKFPSSVLILTEPGWTPEEEEKFAAWERASDVAWSLIDQE